MINDSPETRNGLTDAAQLQGELAMYRSIFAHLPIGTFVYHLEDSHDDRTLRMIAVNAAAESLTGIAATDMLGRTLDENFPGLREQGLPQAYAQVIRTGEPFVTESVYGDERVIQAAFAVRAVPLPGDSVAVMFENITERRQAEYALKQANAELEQRVAQGIADLRQSQTMLQSVLDTSPAAIYIKDLAGKFLVVNRRTSALLGVEPEAMQGKLDTDLFPVEFAEQWRANEQQAIEAGTSVTLEESVMQEDGMRYFLSVRTPVYDDNGQIYAVGGISTDITERKRQEIELRAFKAIADNSPDGVGLIDPQGNIIYLNDATKRMFGRDEIPVGTPVASLYPADMLAHVGNTIIPTALEQGSWQDEVELPHPNGGTWIAQHNVFPVRDEHGNPIGIANFLRDVTEQRKQEIERSNFQQQLIEAQRSTLRELSTPLIPISDHVLIMPLIGTIDSARAQMVMESLLEGVARHQARLVILDITGVMVVDTQVAQAFIQAAQAVRLLGAQVMLTGIQPQIAQTLVHLGVDLSGIITRGSLQSGIAAALRGSQELQF